MKIIVSRSLGDWYRATAEGFPGYEGQDPIIAIGKLITILAQHGKAGIEVQRP